MAKSRSILAIRFSAMGDVAMTIPVMKEVLDANPELTIVFVTNKNWGPLCEGIPRLVFVPADLKGAHKGVPGLYRLFSSLRKTYPEISGVADLHQVLRSRIVRMFFRLRLWIPVAVIDKGREGKKLLTRKEGKVLQPLTTTIERYRQVFRELGLEPGGPGSGVLPKRPFAEKTTIPQQIQIGIAPFATYKEKTYPIEKMEEVIRQVSAREDVQVLLFGGGAREVAQLNMLAARFSNVRVMAGNYSLKEELSIISGLKLMVSMDSANMHLASLFGVPVVSVWGATHPYAGFMGYGQKEEYAAQIDLYCRPCSVFGNKPCYRGDHACMEQLSPERIIEKIWALI